MFQAIGYIITMQRNISLWLCLYRCWLDGTGIVYAICTGIEQSMMSLICRGIGRWTSTIMRPRPFVAGRDQATVYQLRQNTIEWEGMEWVVCVCVWKIYCEWMYVCVHVCVYICALFHPFQPVTKDMSCDPGYRVDYPANINLKYGSSTVSRSVC